MATRMDMTAPHIMAQWTILEPTRLPHPNDDYPQDHNYEIASILRRAVAEHNGNTNPTHHAVLFLMELRADLENIFFCIDIRHKPRATSRDIEDAMHLLEEFLQNITNLDGVFEMWVLPCLELAQHIRNTRRQRTRRNCENKTAMSLPIKTDAPPRRAVGGPASDGQGFWWIRHIQTPVWNNRIHGRRRRRGMATCTRTHRFMRRRC